MSDDVWHPWHYIGERFPHVVVCTSYQLEPGVRGIARGNRIWLCSSLDQAGRRTTLSHEIGHLERGILPHPRHSIYKIREERIVDQLAARRLIPFPKLLDALKWSSHPAELADTLWTTERMVECRMNSLDPIEVSELENELGDRW